MDNSPVKNIKNPLETEKGMEGRNTSNTQMHIRKQAYKDEDTNKENDVQTERPKYHRKPLS
jgi:hypothetical protein